MELLGHFGIAPGQLMPNSWRIVVNCMEIWLATNGDMIKVGELVYLYCLKDQKSMDIISWYLRRGELGLYGVYLRPLGIGNPISFSCLRTALRPPLVRLMVISQSCSASGEPRI